MRGLRGLMKRERAPTHGDASRSAGRQGQGQRTEQREGGMRRARVMAITGCLAQEGRAACGAREGGCACTWPRVYKYRSGCSRATAGPKGDDGAGEMGWDGMREAQKAGGMPRSSGL